jgi:hypothetical protein
MAGQAKGNSCLFVPISDREPYPNSNANGNTDRQTKGYSKASPNAGASHDKRLSWERTK